MTAQEVASLIKQGEGHFIEFKKSASGITKDVYETVCAFSNRDGGHILLGVNDNGEVLGVDKSSLEQMKKDFVTAINNPQKLNPPLYLTTEECEVAGKTVICIYVPSGTQVCRCGNRIFDRNNDSDIDITDNAHLVYQMYARKEDSYYVNKVFLHYGIKYLRPDLIERARKMTISRNVNHPWLSMRDEEILRSAGLILRDSTTQKEGITLAAILLFGKDETIMGALPQHKTDAIFRIENMDRYDDRDVIITNLLESYDRLMAFAKKHLNDPFILEGTSAVSARDGILREIFSNILAHRDYSSGYTSKFVIEKNRMYTENPNRTHGTGVLNIERFEPFAKNPPISKVFREISLADELGSGMRNTYKFTKMYSGGVPEFKEGDFFTTIIPLKAVATEKVGPSSDQDSDQVSDQDVIKKILDYCVVPRSKKEICAFLKFKNLTYFTRTYLNPLLKSGKLVMTIPNKPNSKNQKYCRA